MTKYREIIRLAGLGLSQTNIALSCNASKTTVNKVLKAAREQNLTWPLDPKLTDVERNPLTEFNSNNTELLNVEQVKAKMLELQYIRDELTEWESR